MGPRPKRVPVTFIPAEPQKPAPGSGAPTPPVTQTPAPQTPTPEAPAPQPAVPAPVQAVPDQPQAVIAVAESTSDTGTDASDAAPAKTDEPPRGSRVHWLWNAFVALMLAMLVGITYSNSFQSLWTLDNKYIIQLDPRNKLATYDNFSLVWTQDYWWPKGISGLYRPIPTLSYLLNWAEPFSWESPTDQVVAWVAPDKVRSPGAYQKWREQIRKIAQFDPETEPAKFTQIQTLFARLQGQPMSWTAPDRANTGAYEQWRQQIKALLDVDPDTDSATLKWIASIADRRLNPNRTDLPDYKPFDSWRGLTQKIAQFDPAAEPDKLLLVHRLRAGEMFTWQPPNAQADPDLYQLWRAWVLTVGGFDPDVDKDSLAMVQRVVAKNINWTVPNRETNLREYMQFTRSLQDASGIDSIKEPRKYQVIEQVAKCEQYRGQPFDWDNAGKEKGTPEYEAWKNAAKLHGGFDPDADMARLTIVRTAQAGRGGSVRAVEWAMSWAPRGNGPRVDGTHVREADQVIGFHWVNLIFHWLNVVLVYFLTMRVVKRFWVAVFTAALFGVHPVGTESITNIIGRADLFATFSVLSVTLLYIRQTEKTGWRRVGLLLLMVLAMLFGLFSKESSVAVVAVVLLYDLAMRTSRKILDLNPMGLIPLGLLVLTTIAVPILHTLLSTRPDATKPETVWPYVGLVIGTLGVLFARILYLATPKETLSDRAFGISLAVVMTVLLGIFYTPAFWLLPSLIVFDELLLGTALAPYIGEVKTWWDSGRPFIEWITPYLLMLPPALMMFTVRHYVFFTSTPPEEPFLDNPLRGIGFFRSRMTAVDVMGRQIWLLICPINLSSDYSFDEIPLFRFNLAALNTWVTLLLLVVFTVIVLGTIYLRVKGRKAIFFFVFLFFLNYGPTGNFAMLIGSIMAERFMYLPLIGFAGLAVLGIDAIFRRANLQLDLSPDEKPERAPLWRFAPHALLAMVLVAFGTRAYFRNFVWHEDLTLWEDAITKSPRSFRCYQSLAFALFEKIGQMTPENLRSRNTEKLLDRMISLDEQGFQLVDRLPDEKNSSRLYLHLGMYYTLKGDSLSTAGPDGQSITTDAAKKWYEKAAWILERGSRVDRTFNEVNRQRDVARGKAKTPEEVADVGLSPVYSYMGTAYIKAGRLDEALQAFRYALHLDPNDADAYIRTAQVYLMKNQVSRAAVPLLQAIVINDSRMDAWQLLAQIYSSTATQGAPPPYLVQDGRPRLNIQNDMVKNDLCSAYREFTRAFVLAKRDDMARQSANVAKSVYGFPASLFDPILEEKGARPTPPTPAFYDPAKQPAPIEP
jgi:tetratricopeptide (TPR) repeat protein